jgi:hypothetical protein
VVPSDLGKELETYVVKALVRRRMSFGVSGFDLGSCLCHLQAL